MTGSPPNYPVRPQQCPSLHRGNGCPLKAFMGCNPTPRVLTFFRSLTAATVTVTDAQRQSRLNVEELAKLCAQLHPFPVYFGKSQEAVKGSRVNSRLRVSCPTSPKVTMSLWTDRTFILVKSRASVGADQAEYKRLSADTYIRLKTFAMANWTPFMLPDSSCFETARSTKWQSCHKSCSPKRACLNPDY